MHRHRWERLALGGVIYLLLAVLVWWHVWSSHPTSTTICGCGDPSLFTWFLDWPAYAIAHGHNPIYTTVMGYPHGVNLLANTSEIGIGLPLAPITWIFGPVATLNVALTLAPALSAFAMFVLLRRWTSWMPAAFVGGLLYGFSPLVLSNFATAHLQVVMLVAPPLIIGCLDELLVRQRRRPVAVGVLLGLLLTLQFSVGTEVLAIVVMCGTLGVVLVLIYTRLRSPQTFAGHTPYAVKGCKAAAVTAVVLLAIPAGYALFGPASLPGPIWPVPLSQFASHFSSYLVPSQVGNGGWMTGYNGSSPSDQYLGIGLVAVLLGGTIVWRRDRRLWLFGAVGLVALVLALGAADPLFNLFPLLENIVPSRFDVVLYFCVAVMLGIVLDHAYAGVRVRMARTGSRRQQGSGTSRVPSLVAAGTAVILAAVTIGPIAAYWSQGLPIATRRVTLPTWFAAPSARHLDHQVLLVFPDAVSQESPMTWQALDGMGWSMVDEGGPGGATTRGGKQRQAENLLAIVSSPTYANVGYSPKAKVISSDKIARVRSALEAWKVTTIVIPDEPRLPYYDSIPSVLVASTLMAAATGQQPRYQDGAWVWTNVRQTRHVVPIAGSLYRPCLLAGSIQSATACIVHTETS